MKEQISIRAISSISPLGTSPKGIWDAYRDKGHFLRVQQVGDRMEWVAGLPESSKKEIRRLRQSDPKYKDLDNTVLYAIYAARNAVRAAGWDKEAHFGINLGSSRGATALFEKYHTEFLALERTVTLTSPTTTLGNISSWVAHDLQTKGPELSHSITCSTALHSLLNGVAWIRGGMAEKFLVGGSEAPLTPFTVAQMHAMKIYANVRSNRLAALGSDSVETLSDSGDQSYPCQALKRDKKRNTMVLGEGASVACLEKGVSENSLAVLEGVGYATEVLQHNVSISAEAECFQRSMNMALGEMSPKEVDVIVMHAPGTIKGDSSEFKAIEKVFANKIPFLTTNKWKIGHTFGASGMLSVEMAILMLKHQMFIPVPFVSYDSLPANMNRVMVNAVGFGGNAVSILLKTPN